MNVKELIEMLSHSDVNLNAKVEMVQYYYGSKDVSPVTGMISDSKTVTLTDEEL